MPQWCIVDIACIFAMEIYQKWLNRVISGGRCDFDELYKRLINIKPSTNELKSYYALKTALEVRKGDAIKANESLIKLKIYAEDDVAIVDFLEALIAYIQREIERSELCIDRCLELNPDFLIAAVLKTKIICANFKGIKVKNIFKNDQAKTRFSLDYFIESQRCGKSLSESIDTFSNDLQLNKHFSATGPFEGLSWTSYGFSFHERNYKELCAKAIVKIETLFSIKIEKDFSYNQNIAPIHETISFVGRDLSRAKPQIDILPDNNNKGLQMLCSPGHWITSQNHLLCFVLSEIQALMKDKVQKKLKVHEIGPGCGYMLKVLSGIENISLSGSDCYDSKSFDFEKLAESQSIFTRFSENSTLELLCYHTINSLTGAIDCIVNFPISLNVFPVEFIEADLVYAHLPVVDQFEGNWAPEDWRNFFENIFQASGSQVKSIVIAANNHSKALKNFCFTVSNNELDYFNMKVIDGPFCNGLIVIIRRKYLP